jgi:hypothetical protein
MSQFKSSGDIKAFAHDAGQSYLNAIGLNREDFQLRALKYPLLRLSTDGLTELDRKELAELAKRAFEEADVADAAERIQKRHSSSPIAVAIANVMLSARVSKRMSMLGAVIGAHAARALSLGTHDVGFDVVGAIVGAACLDSIDFVQKIVGDDWKGFAERDV